MHQRPFDVPPANEWTPASEASEQLDKFNDECGVFGIFGHPEAANLTYLGLYALQHRGQESAGICTADGHKMRIARSNRSPGTSPSGTPGTRPPARASCSTPSRSSSTARTARSRSRTTATW